VAQRLPNPRLAKVHRSYTVEEVARLYGVHRNTVRQWIKRDGLPVCDDRRPVLILGSELAAFLTRKRTQNKRPCKPGELYCVRCRVPQSPALGMVDYNPLTATGGNLIGLCPLCGGMMYRRANLARLAAATGKLEVRFTQARQRIDESNSPSVNCIFKTGT
jgi:excisionase family DNA binding protein